jgi:tRNA pseudouridine55 synthase
MGNTEFNGIIVVDKPGNISSAGVVRFVKKALKSEKVGHAGTLDPFAEGVLICCLNQATRLAGFLLRGKKKYAGVLKLGEETDTQDLTGTIVSTGKPVDFSPQAIQNVFRKFEGSIKQLPPVYSALKHNGIPLYKLARRGTPIQKPPRWVHIDNITIREISLPLIRFEVTCSAGTYIRTLCADIGKSLGCGGHLVALKRLESSGFSLAQAISLSELEKLKNSTKRSAHIIPMADALPNMPQLRADTRLAEKIQQGKIISAADLIGSDSIAGAHLDGSEIKIVDWEGDLIAILKYKEPGHRLAYHCVFPKQEKRQIG